MGGYRLGRYSAARSVQRVRRSGGHLDHLALGDLAEREHEPAVAAVVQHFCSPDVEGNHGGHDTKTAAGLGDRHAMSSREFA